MKNKEFDLNEYELINEKDDYNCVSIKPQTINGIQPPTLIYRLLNAPTYIKDPEGVEWHKDVQLDTYAEKKQWEKLIRWWYDNALSNDEYKQIMNDTYRNALDQDFDMKSVVLRLKQAQLDCIRSKRYPYQHRYLQNNITTKVKQYLFGGRR